MPYWTMVGGLGLDVPRSLKKNKKLDSTSQVMQKLGVFVMFFHLCVWFPRFLLVKT